MNEGLETVVASTHSHAHAEHDGHHVTPLGTYLTIYFVLLVLTVVTVAVSYMGLPSTLSIIVAMMVASVKASLVVLWFMHLKYDTKFNVLVFLSSIWFIALFFIFTMFDLGSRDSILAVTGNFELRMDRATGTKSPVADEKWLLERTWREGVLRNPADLWASQKNADLAAAAAVAAAAAPATAPAAHGAEGGHAAPAAEGAPPAAEGAATPAAPAADGAAPAADGAAAPAAPAEGAAPTAAPTGDGHK